MAKFDDLPIELLSFIFRHLDFQDLPNVRLVSKKFRYFIDEVKVKQLVIVLTHYKRPNFERWYMTEKVINWRNQIKVSKVIYCPFDLSCVKKLMIDHRIISGCYYFGDKYFNEFIRIFTSLKHMEMVGVEPGKEHYFLLLLPDTLKTFRIDFTNVLLAIVARNLETIRCDTPVIALKFRQPIKHLKIDYIEGDHLRNLPSLEYFGCVQAHTIADYDYEYLLLFPNLKEIHFETEQINGMYRYRKLESLMNKVILERERAKSNVKIFCDETEIVGSKLFNEYGFEKYFHFDFIE